MDLIIDFFLTMIGLIKTEKIDESDIPRYKKVIKKILLFLIIIIVAILYYVLF